MNRVLPLVFFVLFFAPPLWAQESYRDFERGLNLSEAQKAQVDGIKNKYVDEWRGIKNESVRKRLELRELNRDRPENRERAAKLERDLQDLEVSKQRLFRQYRGEVSGVLNNEQRGRYNQFVDRERRSAVNPPRYAPPPVAPPPSGFSPGNRRGNRMYGR